MFCAVIWHNGLNDDNDDHDDSWPVGLRYILNLRRLCHRNKQRSESACICTQQIILSKMRRQCRATFSVGALSSEQVNYDTTR